jgi:uncharacterized protein
MTIIPSPASLLLSLFPSLGLRIERASDTILAALATLHLAALALLALALLTLASPALAQEEAIACGGINLIDEMQRSDPAALDMLRAEASAIANNQGLLWKIERDDAAPSWLYGTMHVADPRVLDLKPSAALALDAAATIVIETAEILDPVQSQAAMLMNPELTMFTDGTSLADLMSPEEYAMVEEALDAIGLPIGAVSRMKPWMIGALVALPECEMARKASGESFLDKEIAESAAAQGKSVLGLETIEEQLTAMAGLPMDFHIRGLVETIALGDLIDDITATMTDLYVAGDIGMILPLIRAVSPPGDGMDASYADFEERIILSRNRLMARRAAPIIDEGNAFIAVGALHLPGDEGLVELLRADGYRVTRAD